MKASIVVEPGVSESAIGAAVYATNVLASNLPATLDGLQADVVRLDDRLPHSSYQDNGVEASFIHEAPAWADESFNLFVTRRELYLGREALHGYALAGNGIALVSAAKLDRSNPDEPFELFAVSLHEAGHAFGLVHPRARQYNHATDHCGNTCTMQAGAERAPIDCVKLALGWSGLQGGFCSDCRSDLSGLRIIA